MTEQIHRTGLHRGREIKRTNERHGDGFGCWDVENVLHTLLLIERKPVPAAVARSSQQAVRIVDPKSMACPGHLGNGAPIRRGRVRHAVPRPYRYIDGVELRL